MDRFPENKSELKDLPRHPDFLRSQEEPTYNSLHLTVAW
jgi:hypothetical protein